MDDALDALVNLGYKLSDAQKAVEGLADDTFEDILRKALKRMTR
ncbi:MAG: hypothetical protein LBP51_05470 [Deferribacteraceae bacterium]|nr:hypothetical protein [Deferribacteraceae bacterium]